MKMLLSFILGVSALTYGIYFTAEHGPTSSALIASAWSMFLAIIFALVSGVEHGRQQQQKDMAEMMDKSNSLLRMEMDKACAKRCCSECKNSPWLTANS